MIYLFLFISVIGGFILGYIVSSIESRKDTVELASFRPSLPTRIYDVKGKLVSELFQHQRKLITLEDIPRPVIGAFLAVEDTNFYEHFGIDFLGILRAFLENVKAMSIVQGGSTITQQLVKGLYTSGEKTFFRKILEAVLALEVEREFSKNEILEMYFNQIYLGHGAYGLASASRFYFDKNVQDLDLMDGTVLAALPKAPHRYSPFRSFHRSYEKNRVILNRLVDLEILSAHEAEVLYERYWEKFWNKIAVTPDSATIYGEKEDKAPYFSEYVRQSLVKRFGEENVYKLGLQVYTTLDLDHQFIAEEELKSRILEQDVTARDSNLAGMGVDTNLIKLYNEMRTIFPLSEISYEYSLFNDFKDRYKKMAENTDLLTSLLPLEPLNDINLDYLTTYKNIKRPVQVQGAFISMDPHSGRITAMIGGREFSSSDQFNRALMARRQPGSAFKPFVYGAAIEDRAVHYASGFLDAPMMDIQPDGSMWAPSNYSGEYRGYVLLNKALAHSLNLISVQIYDKIGPEKIVNFASKLMKIPRGRFQQNPSLALGSSEVTPMELLYGYSVIANEGMDLLPHGIRYVTDRDGNVVYDEEKEINGQLNQLKNSGQLQVIEPGVAFIMRKMMRGVVDNGTANYGVRNLGAFKYQAAGKTGTTSAWNDAWFGGFTTDLAAVVWFGLDNGSMTLGRHQGGGLLCAPIWGKFMRRVYDVEKRKPENFDEKAPEDVYAVAVCSTMGKLINPDCMDSQIPVTSYFMSATGTGENRKFIQEDLCDCNVQETRGFLDILQEQENLSDEELGKTRNFNSTFGND